MTRILSKQENRETPIKEKIRGKSLEKDGGPSFAQVQRNKSSVIERGSGEREKNKN